MNLDQILRALDPLGPRVRRLVLDRAHALGLHGARWGSGDRETMASCLAYAEGLAGPGDAEILAGLRARLEGGGAQ